jgi:hypothetical protein
VCVCVCVCAYVCVCACVCVCVYVRVVYMFVRIGLYIAKGVSKNTVSSPLFLAQVWGHIPTVECCEMLLLFDNV